MSTTFTEDEMRQALFGTAMPSTSPTDIKVQFPATDLEKSRVLAPVASKPRTGGTGFSSRLRVTLHVTRGFEGDVEVFVHDADTLSTLVAEQEAKSAAKKKKFKYFDVISIEPASS